MTQIVWVFIFHLLLAKAFISKLLAIVLAVLSFLSYVFWLLELVQFLSFIPCYVGSSGSELLFKS